ELVDADLERDPGAGGTLGEDQADGLAAERGLAVLACAHLLCELEQVEQLGAGDVLEREEVALGCHEPSWERGRPEWQESNWSLACPASVRSTDGGVDG